MCRVLPAAAPPRPAGTGRDEPREGGREAARSLRPARAPAAPGRGAGVVPALPPPKVRERPGGPGAPGGGGGEGSAGSGITCDSPCTARSAAICKYFCLFLPFFPFPAPSPPCPRLSGAGGGGGRTARSRAPRCAQIHLRSATPSHSLCCGFSSCLSVSVCARTCSSTLAS